MIIRLIKENLRLSRPTTTTKTARSHEELCTVTSGTDQVPRQDPDLSTEVSAATCDLPSSPSENAAASCPSSSSENAAASCDLPPSSSENAAAPYGPLDLTVPSSVQTTSGTPDLHLQSSESIYTSSAPLDLRLSSPALIDAANGTADRPLPSSMPNHASPTPSHPQSFSTTGWASPPPEAGHRIDIPLEVCKSQSNKRGNDDSLADYSFPDVLSDGKNNSTSISLHSDTVECAEEGHRRSARLAKKPRRLY